MEDKEFKLESFMRAAELVKFMNKKRLTKDDVIGILSKEDFYFLIYID